MSLPYCGYMSLPRREHSSVKAKSIMTYPRYLQLSPKEDRREKDIKRVPRDNW